MLLFAITCGKAQNLTNNQLLKLYGILLDAVAQPRDKFIDAVILPINKGLSSLDPKWSAMKQKDLMYGDNELYFTWSHPHPGTAVLNFEVTVKTIQMELSPSLQYISQQPEIFRRNLAEIKRIGKFVNQTTNELKGVDMRYKIGNVMFLYSTFPPRPDDTKRYGRPLTTYKIAINE